jgi:hypothetical protein
MSFIFPLVAAALLGQADDDRVFTSDAANCRFAYAADWKKVPAQRGPGVHVVLRRGPASLSFGAVDGPMTLEDFARSTEQFLKGQRDFQRIAVREHTTVADEDAVRFKAVVGSGLFAVAIYATIWTHEGMTYDLIGSPGFGSAEAFEKEQQALLDSFKFLGDRPGWKEKDEGKPRPVALAGGLATFTLNRPRWQDQTLDGQLALGYDEEVLFGYHAGGSWLRLAVRPAAGSAEDELEQLRTEYAALVRDDRWARKTAPGRGGDVEYYEVACEYAGVPHVVRMAAFVVDGLALHVREDNYASRSRTARRDWEQVLKTLRFQKRSKPDEPLAYPPRRPVGPGQWASDPALAAYLTRAQQVVPEQLARQVVLFSPDGARRVVRHGTRLWIDGPARGARDLLEKAADPAGCVAWSPDGKRVAYATPEGIGWADLAAREWRKLPGIHPAALAFGPDGKELWACTLEPVKPADARPAMPTGPAFRLPPVRPDGRRLERIRLADGTRTTLIQFPLGRFNHVAVAPDGKHIAVVTNRDYPRTATVGGHVYVAAADGTDLRQLTRDPEDVTALAWTADGKGLLAVRRLAVGKDGAVGVGGSADLYRLDVATGAGTNLTRSGMVGRAWGVGDDVLIEVLGAQQVAAQAGIFRVQLAALA